MRRIILSGNQPLVVLIAIKFTIMFNYPLIPLYPERKKKRFRPTIPVKIYQKCSTSRKVCVHWLRRRFGYQGYRSNQKTVFSSSRFFLATATTRNDRASSINSDRCLWTTSWILCLFINKDAKTT